MENKSIEQFQRMLKLIGHKQVNNKFDVKEAINKAINNPLLKESKANVYDQDVEHSTKDVETNKEVGSGSDPKYYANTLVSATGGDRNFDMPYRMWIIGIPYGEMELRINQYNKKNLNEPIEFDFDDLKNSWIKKPFSTSVKVSTLGNVGFLEKIGKYILEFMARIYSGQLNAAESKFESDCGDKLFETDKAKSISFNFLREFLGSVTFSQAFGAAKIKVDDEVDKKIAARGFRIGKEKVFSGLTGNKYNARIPNFNAWALEVVKNEIINQYSIFGERNLVSRADISRYLDTLKYPYVVIGNERFTERIRAEFGTKMTKKDWGDYKRLSGTQYKGYPTIIGKKYFAFSYTRPELLLADIISAQEGKEKYSSFSPLSLQYISANEKNVKLKSLIQSIFTSSLKPSGEGKPTDSPSKEYEDAIYRSMGYSFGDKSSEGDENEPYNGEKNSLVGGSEEQKDFERLDREERVQRLMGTKTFIDKFSQIIGNKNPKLYKNFIGITNRANRNNIKNNKSLVKEFYSFIGDLISESLLSFTKASREKHQAKMKDIGGIYNEVFEKYYNRNQNLSDEEKESLFSKERLGTNDKGYNGILYLTDDNLSTIKNAVNEFMYADKKEKRETFKDMELRESIQKIRNLIREHLMKEFGTEYQADLDEERISNEEGAKKVNEKHNFIGSQVFGEDIGNIGKETDWKDGMYGVFSYGEQFPIFVYTNSPFYDQDGNLKNKDGKFRWFHNIEQYKYDIDKDGEKEVMKSVEKHKDLLKPNSTTHGLTTATLLDMIKAFKNKHKIKELSHVSIKPGEGQGIHFGSSHKKD